MLKLSWVSRNIAFNMKKSQSKEKWSVQKSLIDQKESSFKKYVALFIGRKGLWSFIKYEAIIFLFSWIPGAPGLILRRIFYPLIIKKVGKGVAFGHHITLRHPHRITIGDNSFVDDYAVLDAKTEEDLGISISGNVIVGRNTILSCKGGTIWLDEYANVSSNCTLLSETKIYIGKYAFLAGHCYLVAGGNHSFDRIDIPIMHQPSMAKGGIIVGDDCWLGASTVLLDGVSLGKGCVIGAGAVVTKSLSSYSVAVGIPARMVRDRRG